MYVRRALSGVQSGTLRAAVDQRCKKDIVIATSRCTIEGQRCEGEEKMKGRVEKRCRCRHLAAGEAGRVSARVGGGWGNGETTRILTCFFN